MAFPVFRVLLPTGFSLLLVSCAPDAVDVQYKLEAPETFELLHNGFYSTMVGDVERVGTISETYDKVTFSPLPDGILMERSFIADKSRGYHKNSLPQELAQRVDIRLKARGSEVQSIEGYSSFDSSVVEKLPIPEKFRAQLRGPQYPKVFDRLEKRRWEITHLLSGPIPEKSNLTQQLEEKHRLPIPMLTVDSVVSGTMETVEGRRCFKYTVYYQDPEPFPYFLWEQHAYGIEEGKPLREFRPDTAWYEVAHDVLIEPVTGLTCKEREIRKGIHKLRHPSSDAMANFQSSLVIERIYRKP